MSFSTTGTGPFRSIFKKIAFLALVPIFSISANSKEVTLSEKSSAHPFAKNYTLSLSEITGGYNDNNNENQYIFEIFLVSRHKTKTRTRSGFVFSVDYDEKNIGELGPFAVTNGSTVAFDEETMTIDKNTIASYIEEISLENGVQPDELAVNIRIYFVEKDRFLNPDDDLGSEHLTPLHYVSGTFAHDVASVYGQYVDAYREAVDVELEKMDIDSGQASVDSRMSEAENQSVFIENDDNGGAKAVFTYTVE